MPRQSKNLLFIVHAPSANTSRLREAACGRVAAESETKMIIKTPFETNARDALEADGVLIGTTENIGYMAGATKDFFDRSYNDLLDVSAGKPAAIYIRAGLDGTGSKHALSSIMTGLRWRLVGDILVCRGAWQEKEFSDKVSELALTLALTLELGG